MEPHGLPGDVPRRDAGGDPADVHRPEARRAAEGERADHGDVVRPDGTQHGRRGLDLDGARLLDDAHPDGGRRRGPQGALSGGAHGGGRAGTLVLRGVQGAPGEGSRRDAASGSRPKAPGRRNTRRVGPFGLRTLSGRLAAHDPPLEGVACDGPLRQRGRRRLRPLRLGRLAALEDVRPGRRPAQGLPRRGEGFGHPRARLAALLQRDARDACPARDFPQKRLAAQDGGRQAFGVSRPVQRGGAQVSAAGDKRDPGTLRRAGHPSRFRAVVRAQRASGERGAVRFEVRGGSAAHGAASGLADDGGPGEVSFLRGGGGAGLGRVASGESGGLRRADGLCRVHVAVRLVSAPARRQQEPRPQDTRGHRRDGERIASFGAAGHRAAVARAAVRTPRRGAFRSGHDAREEHPAVPEDGDLGTGKHATKPRAGTRR